MFNLFSIKITTKQIMGLIFLTLLLAIFISFSRFPKLDAINEDLEAVTKPVVECFQGFCVATEKSLFDRWKSFSIAYFNIISAGMVFAFLVAGLTETFIIPNKINTYRSKSVFSQTLIGLTIGPIWNLCSACVVPIANSFHKKGSGSAYAIAMIQGSSTLNIPALIMSLTIFTPLLGISRLIISIVGALIISPLVALSTDNKAYQKILENEDVLRRNYQMMQLYAPSLGIKAKNIIRETIRNSNLLFNKTELIKMMMQDGFGEINFIELFQHFNKMCLDR